MIVKYNFEKGIINKEKGKYFSKKDEEGANNGNV